MTDSKTIRYALCERLMLLAHGSEPPTQDEWATYVKDLGDAHKNGAQGLLVLTDGPGPNSAQRKMVSSFDMKSAVLTPSQVARGMVTAISWFGAKIRAFSPDQIEDALTFLEVTLPDKRTDVCRRLAGLRLELAGKPALIAARASPDDARKLVSSSLEALAKR